MESLNQVLELFSPRERKKPNNALAPNELLDKIFWFESNYVCCPPPTLRIRNQGNKIDDEFVEKMSMEVYKVDGSFGVPRLFI